MGTRRWRARGGIVEPIRQSVPAAALTHLTLDEPEPKQLPEHDPWHHARENGHTYLSPEDIQAAINAGGSRELVQRAALKALGAKNCEDWSLCAFIAGRFERRPDYEDDEVAPPPAQGA
jgi:hypothetical protein